MRILALVLSSSLATVVQAQTTFPSRPVTLVLPSAPGDPTDLIARVLQPKMSERLGQPFVVENRPGGSAVIASSAVAKAQPDGHTLLLALSAHSINPIALKELPYDTFRDFAPVTLLARFPLIVGANPGLKESNLAEFIASAKVQANLNVASPGAGADRGGSGRGAARRIRRCVARDRRPPEARRGRIRDRRLNAEGAGSAGAQGIRALGQVRARVRYQVRLAV